MKRAVGAALIAIIAMLALVSNVSAQEGQIDMPSIAAGAHHIFLENRTAGEVVFYLETANTDRTEHHLAAGEAATYSGDDGDQWFNIEVYSAGTKVVYGINVGERNYFDWNSAGVLDVYKLPPR
jgi:hypothetical protein